MGGLIRKCSFEFRQSRARLEDDVEFDTILSETNVDDAHWGINPKIENATGRLGFGQSDDKERWVVLAKWKSPGTNLKIMTAPTGK